MNTIAESNVLLRTEADFPADFKVATEEMIAGWKLMRTGGAKRLKQKINKCGWNLIQVAHGALRSGVGPSAKDAISAALKLALRRLDSRSNAVEVEGVEVTKYPWFFLARVRVRPFRVQLDAELTADFNAEPAEEANADETMPHLGEVHPQFGASLPMLKNLLVTGRA